MGFGGLGFRDGPLTGEFMVSLSPQVGKLLVLGANASRFDWIVSVF